MPAWLSIFPALLKLCGSQGSVWERGSVSRTTADIFVWD